jgi:hypothetical protein
MSQLLAIGSSADTVLCKDGINDRMRPNWFSDTYLNWRGTDFSIEDHYVTPYWPGTAGLSTDAGGMGGDIMSAAWWEEPEKILGSSGRLGVTGVTRDVYGSILGGATVKLFRTADDTLQSSTTSDVNNGTYLLTTPFTDAHYVVASKSGSPSVQGATVNTLLAG